MKYYKKILALALALALALTLGIPVFATQTTDQQDPPPDVSGLTLPTRPEDTKPDLSSHQFTAYQIFTGTLVDGNALTQIQWGSALQGLGPAFLDELKADPKLKNGFKDITYNSTYPARTADAIARVIAEWTEGKTATDLASIFAQTVYNFLSANNVTGQVIPQGGTKLADGYYLIEDVTQPAQGETNFVRNLSFLRMVANETFDPAGNVKVDLPELDKKVLEVNDSVPTDTGTWQDVADHDIGDSVPFVLTGTLPSNFDDFVTYQYTFHDTLSAGLEFENNVIVWLRKGDEKTDVTEEFDVEPTENGFTVSCDNLKSISGITKDHYIQVVYTAKLTKDAVIGGAGNTNTVYLQFSNDPNNDGEGDTGITPPKVVTVFTFQIVANKVSDQIENGTPKPLPGAGFTLYKVTGYAEGKPVYTEVLTIEPTETEKPIQFTFPGLDEGKYKLVESKVPDGYNKAEDMYFTITSDLDEKTETVKSLTVGDVKDAADNVILNMAGAKDANGNLPTLGFTYTPADGSLTTNIVNLTGVLLPSTGGIGTTIFYVIGGLLILAAVVLLITKKRMGDQDKPE